jgi:demethylmenaquinone methyltransferase/2-methoxy-6-polyprenyl-1,4-benzoquinol methylase
MKDSNIPGSGATPAGATSEPEAARWVRGMFARVAGSYDLANHLLSLNIDRRWRAHTVNRVRQILSRPDARVLDLCCGTGDLLLALETQAAGRVFLGADFCHPMLTAAARKIAQKHSRAALFEADALTLPLRAASVDLVTIAFGFRNLANYGGGLREMLRILRPGGMAAILEFSQPPNRLFAAFYNFYSRKILPAIGGLISGDKEAYRYLPESVRKFPAPDELAAQMRAAGFTAVSYKRLTAGIVTLHIGEILRQGREVAKDAKIN